MLPYTFHIIGCTKKKKLNINFDTSRGPLDSLERVAECISVSIRFALLIPNVKMIFFKNQAPPQEVTVLRCHGLQPRKGTMVCLCFKFNFFILIYFNLILILIYLNLNLFKMNTLHKASALFSWSAAHHLSAVQFLASVERIFPRYHCRLAIEWLPPSHLWPLSSVLSSWEHQSGTWTERALKLS